MLDHSLSPRLLILPTHHESLLNLNIQCHLRHLTLLHRHLQLHLLLLIILILLRNDNIQLRQLFFLQLNSLLSLADLFFVGGAALVVVVGATVDFLPLVGILLLAVDVGSEIHVLGVLCSADHGGLLDL